MKSRELAKSVPQEGVYTIVRDAAGQTTGVSVRLDQLAHPQTTYHATWCKFVAEMDGVLLCFGHRLDRTLLSRLDIAMSFEEFSAVVDNSKAFIATVAADQAGVDPDPAAWAVDSVVPITHKYLVESASLISMAYWGSHAEMAFFRLSARDLYNLTGHGTGRADPPSPVVAVTLPRRMLCWMVQEMAKFRDVKPLPLTIGALR